MTIDAKVSGSFIPATPYARVDGVWRPIREAYARVSGSWLQFFTSLSIDIAPSPMVANGGPGAVTTTPASVILTGGQAPFAYDWSVVEGSVVINAPSGASTTFTGFAPAESGDANTSTVQVTVTDSEGASATVQLTVVIVRS